MHASDFNLSELSNEAADVIMQYPWQVDQFCDCVRKISRFICVQIDTDLNSVDNSINADTTSESESFVE